MTATLDVPPRPPLDIILVEDDDGDAKAIRRALSRARIANPVIRVLDGVEALALLRGEAGDPPRSYVLLVDINMPRMNGHELMREIRRDPALNRAVAFMMTTSRDDADISRAYDANVAGYIVKQDAGVGFLDLMATLDHYWRIVELPDMAAIRGRE